MSMNKDLVAQAVAAIPQWIEFLNKKDAEQDALLEQMKGTTKPTLMQKATSLLKRGNDKTDAVLEDDAHQQIAKDDVSLKKDPMPNNKPLKKDLTPNDDQLHTENKSDEARWAPTDVAVKEEEYVEETPEEEEEKALEDQVNNMFEG